jgi:hypothetical protein
MLFLTFWKISVFQDADVPEGQHAKIFVACMHADKLTGYSWLS